MRDLRALLSSKTRTVRKFRHRHGVLSTSVLIVLKPLWDLGIFRAGHILCVRPEWVNAALQDSDGSVEHRFLTESEIGALRDPSKSEFPQYVSDLGIARGDPCFGSFSSGELASVTWVAETPFVQWGSLLLFPEDYAFIHSRFTLHRFRGRRLQPTSIVKLTQALGERGLRGLLSTVDVTNPASVKGARRAGFKKVGTVIQLGSKRRVYTVLSPGARRFGFSLGRNPGEDE